MKAASPLCLEPRALLWLLEVEEAEGSCPEQLCVSSLAPLRLAGLLPLHCALSLSQPASLPLSGRYDIL